MNNIDLFKLEESIIDDKLKEGVNGLNWLVINSNEDISDYGALLRFAGVTSDEHKEFIVDSLKMKPDEFYQKYNVNFWISRSMNIQFLKVGTDRLPSLIRNFFILHISNLKEGD